jgi:hypothetical protein
VEHLKHTVLLYIPGCVSWEFFLRTLFFFYLHHILVVHVLATQFGINQQPWLENHCHHLIFFPTGHCTTFGDAHSTVVDHHKIKAWSQTKFFHVKEYTAMLTRGIWTEEIERKKHFFCTIMSRSLKGTALHQFTCSSPSYKTQNGQSEKEHVGSLLFVPVRTCRHLSTYMCISLPNWVYCFLFEINSRLHLQHDTRCYLGRSLNSQNAHLNPWTYNRFTRGPKLN